MSVGASSMYGSDGLAFSDALNSLAPLRKDTPSHVAAERGRAGRQRQQPSADEEEVPAHETTRQRLHD